MSNIEERKYGSYMVVAILPEKSERPLCHYENFKEDNFFDARERAMAVFYKWEGQGLETRLYCSQTVVSLVAETVL